MIFGRRIEPRRLLSAGWSFVRLVIGLRRVRRPVSVLRHYLNQTSPEYVDLRSGHRFYFSSHPHDLVSFCLVFLKEEYGHIEGNDVVCDVGANIGSFTIYAAIAGAKKVYSFEPSLEAFETLSRNVAVNQLADVVSPIHKAVTGRSGDIIPFPLKSSPFNTLVTNTSHEIPIDRLSDDLREHILATTSSSGVGYEDVSTVSLSDFLADEGISYVDFVKMDCEGAELLILPTLATTTMSRIGKIRMECHVDPALLIGSLHPDTHIIERQGEDALWLLPAAEKRSVRKSDSAPLAHALTAQSISADTLHQQDRNAGMTL
jgi:FkbM family methyltransferase